MKINFEQMKNQQVSKSWLEPSFVEHVQKAIKLLSKNSLFKVIAFTTAILSLSAFENLQASEDGTVINPKIMKTVDLTKGYHTFHNSDKSKSFLGRLVSYNSEKNTVVLKIKGKAKPYTISLNKLNKDHWPSVKLASIELADKKGGVLPVSLVTGKSLNSKASEFKNTPFQRPSRSYNVCAGVCSVLAVEQALGRKHQGLKTVLDLSAMIRSSNRNGQSPVSSEFATACYGLISEDFTPNDTSHFKYKIDDGLAKSPFLTAD